MAGVTTASCSFKLSTPISSGFTPKPQSLSFHFPCFLKFSPARRSGGCRLRHCDRLVVTTYIRRFGGRSRRRSRGFWDPSEEGVGSDAEEQALDLSRIGSTTVRLIDEQQNMVGIVSKDEAMQMASDAKLDLVIVSADAAPPVVRILDYRKHMFEEQKRKKDQKKKSNATRMEMKEVKMGFKIDDHDYAVRFKAAQKFLKDGNKIKVIIHLKGRENEFRNVAIDLMRRFQKDIGELGKEESKNFEDKNIYMIILPKKTAPPKAQPQSMENEVSTNE